MTTSDTMTAGGAGRRAYSKALTAGTALTVAGAVVGACGLAICTRAAVTGVRRFLAAQQDPAGAVMRRAVEAARAMPANGARPARDRTPAGARTP